MKKKIGIMTIWWSKDNYGQFLQMFALQKALEQLGHSPFLIRYNKFGESRSDKILKLFNPVKLFSSLKHKLTSVSSKAMSEPDRGFDRFMNK